MRSLKITLTLILVGVAVWLIAPLRSSATPDRTLSPEVLIKLHPALAKQLLTDPNAEVRVQIVMREQVAPMTLTRPALIAELQARADRSWNAAGRRADRGGASSSAPSDGGVGDGGGGSSVRCASMRDGLAATDELRAPSCQRPAATDRLHTTRRRRPTVTDELRTTSCERRAWIYAESIGHRQNVAIRTTKSEKVRDPHSRRSSLGWRQ